MTKLPYIPLFVANWRSDTALRMCSAAARGLWIDMICIMHEAEPRGQLLVKGHAPTVEQLSRLVSMSVEETASCLAELEANEVFSVKRNGIIFSRKMERDEIKASRNRDNGAKGGNPALLRKHARLAGDDPASPGNTNGNDGSVNRPDIHEDKRPDNGPDNGQDKAHGRSSISNSIPEDKNRSSSSTACEPFDVPPDDAVDAAFRRFMAAYPLKVGEVQAEAEWITAVTRAPIETILAAAKAYALSRVGEDPKFTVQPAKWLANRRWTDQLPEPASVTPGSDPERDAKIARWRRQSADYAAYAQPAAEPEPAPDLEPAKEESR